MSLNRDASKSDKSLPKGLSAELVVEQNNSYKEPQIIGDWVLWLEQRPLEGGRTTALIRPFGLSNLSPQELTPYPINLRSRIHTYGGGVVAIAIKDNHFLLTWIDAGDNSLWKQAWSSSKTADKNSGNFLSPTETPIRLSAPGDLSLADGLIDLRRDLWIGVMEKKGKDFLVSFRLSKKNQSPEIIHRPEDFAGYITLNHKKDMLAWIEWKQPFMPWERSELWLGDLNTKGELSNKDTIRTSKQNQHRKISFFQPLWSPSDELLVSEDSNGWWNIIKSDGSLTDREKLRWDRPWEIEAETGEAQWIYGMCTTAFAGNNLIAITCKNSESHLNKFNQDGTITEIKQPFNDLSALNACGSHVVAIASNKEKSFGLLELDLHNQTWKHTPANNTLIEVTQISKGESIWFTGFDGKQTQAWYYPPSTKSKKDAPLLVKSHSGPTSMAKCGFDLGIQFWTSRGWGVVDVNYGGSTGFGREYRERLNGKWGIVDVFDCTAAAKHLIQLGKANPQQIAIEGGSAGGFTTLACLCFSDVFKAGACRYAVSDLVAMNSGTHRFEEKYLESLVGRWPEEKEIYKERSPLFNAKKIKCPVIFFQGLKDKVVQPEHTFQMGNALKENNIPLEIHTFPSEGHGFRDAETKLKVLKLTEIFFNKYLNL